MAEEIRTITGRPPFDKHDLVPPHLADNGMTYRHVPACDLWERYPWTPIPGRECIEVKAMVELPTVDGASSPTTRGTHRRGMPEEEPAHQ